MGRRKSTEKICAICTSITKSNKGGDNTFERFYSEFVSPNLGTEGKVPSRLSEKGGGCSESVTVCSKCLPCVENVISSKRSVDLVEENVRKLQKQVLKELNCLVEEVKIMWSELEVIRDVMMRREGGEEGGKREDDGRSDSKENEMIRKVRDSVEKVVRDIKCFETKSTTASLENPEERRRSKRRSKLPSSSEPEPEKTPTLQHFGAHSPSGPEPVSFWDINVKVESSDPMNLNDTDDDSMEFAGVPSPIPENPSDDDNGDLMDNCEENDSEPIDHLDDISSNEEEIDDSSDEDFVPEPEEDEKPVRPKSTGKKRGPYLKMSKIPTEANEEGNQQSETSKSAYPLKDGISAFRRKLIRSISAADSLTTSTNLPPSPRDPRKKYVIQYNPEDDTFHIEGIEIILLDKQHRFQCSSCKLILGRNPRSGKPQDLIFDHILAKHLDAYKCRHCEFLGEDWASFKSHRSKNHPETQVMIPCDICGKPIIEKGMKRHKWTHMSFEEKRDPANMAAAQFPVKHPELYHSRRYQCTTCGKAFKTGHILRAHQDLHKNLEEREHIMCPKCGLVLLKVSYQTHLKNKCSRRENLKLRQCPICKKVVENVKILYAHLQRDHPEERAYSCEICGKRFKIKPDLKKHMPVHSDERKHICQLCGAGFKAKKNLKRHENGCRQKLGVSW